MRKWYVPLTMLGLGGLGLLFVTERGQQAVRALVESLGEPVDESLPGVDRELAQIESALDEIAADLAR
ncbi:MAG: hypothetical protein HYX28_08320 [Candidatus Koribacter versatilis]|uniref:Uncharacterized protein n=1 Tax=Candidatus Korobacter versatilis TaxID=658062 RepID=A0A932A912_9BACT|nr:hypothetical protein [Candidatus Koribacter versatilis]